MKHAPQHRVIERGRLTGVVQRCPRCRTDALVLQRRHVSPASLGDAVVTEFYECDCCDATYQYSPAQNRWRPISQ